MKAILMMGTLLISSTSLASSYPTCKASIENLTRLPGMDLCVSDIKDPDSACVCPEISQSFSKSKQKSKRTTASSAPSSS